MWQDSKNIYHLFVAFLANMWFGWPSRKLTVIGVTGTDGKTTTTHMIYEMLKDAGKKVSMVSTIKAVIGGKDYDTGFHVTTPGAHVLPRYLKEAVDNGDEYFVLEISSHALDQNRAAFVRVAIGVLTNLSHEHIDYHKTLANYANAKFKLLRAAQKAIVMPKGIPKEFLPIARFDAGGKKVVTFGLKTGILTQSDWKFDLTTGGEFNILNALSAAAVANVLGIPKTTTKETLEHFTGIPGRFEEIKTGKDFRVIIDFAHKPNALEQAIKSAAALREKGRIIVMYGCASQRDILKRPMMGEISGRLADITVLTDEDPRWEYPMKIIDEIAQGCVRAGAREFSIFNFQFSKTKEHVFYKIPDRKEAIEFIIKKLARKGDVILLCGKGHEQSINYLGVEKPWSEHKAVAEALKA